MAPRGRHGRPGLTRMHAAEDAMFPFGFDREVVLDTVKDLLKEYGGDEGWPFIEADAYKVLLDAILERLDATQENRGEDKNTPEGEAPLAIAGPSTRVEPEFSDVTNALQNESKENKDSPAQVEEEKKRWKDIVTCIQEVGCSTSNREHSEDPGNHENALIKSPAMLISPPPVSTPSIRQGRKPSYGWIDAEDEDEDFIELTPAPRLIPCPLLEQVENPIVKTEKGVKRTSRWHERP